MKLTLKNFKKYRKQSFAFPPHKFTLVHGRNGVGKSTLFKALSHALYGCQKNPYSHGTTTCRVDLTLNGADDRSWSMTRRNHPNVLQVKVGDSEYQDDEAQAKIESIMGMTYDQFRAACYVHERDVSVLDMTPSQRLKFVQSIVDGRRDPQELKAMTELIRREQTDLKQSEHEYEMRRETHELLRSRLPHALPTEPSVSESQLLLDHDAWLKDEARHRDDHVRLKQEEAQAQAAQASYEAWIQCHAQCDQVAQQIATLSAKRDALEVRWTSAKTALQQRDALVKLKERESLLTSLAELRRECPRPITTLLSTEERQTLETQKAQWHDQRRLSRQYDQWRVEEQECQRAWKDMIRLVHWKPDPQETWADQCTTFKEEMNQRRDKHGRVQDQCRSLRDAISHHHASEERLTCPVCSSSLSWNQDHELVAESTPAITDPSSLDTLTHDLSRCERRLASLTPWVTHRPVLLSYLKRIAAFLMIKPPPHVDAAKVDTQLQDVESRLRDDTYHREKAEREQAVYQQKVQMLERQLASCPIISGHVWDPVLYQTVKEEASRYPSLTRDRDELLDELQRLEKQHQQLLIHQERYYTQSEARHGLVTIQQALQAWQTHDMLRRQQAIDYETMTRAWTTYHDYCDQQRHVTEMQTLLDDLTNKIKASRYRLEGLQGLVATYHEAEILATQRTVDDVNEALKVHIDELFDGDMTLRLEAYKKHATKEEYKPSMSIVAEYCGHPLKDLVEDLSDGQFQLCTIALRLAVGDVLQRPFLLMDESLNKLHSETHQQMLNYLKSLTRDTAQPLQVIIISHHAIDGLFDHVIELT